MPDLTSDIDDAATRSPGLLAPHQRGWTLALVLALLLGVIGIVLTISDRNSGPGLTAGASSVTAVLVALRSSHDQERQRRRHERELQEQAARLDSDQRRRDDAPAHQVIATLKRQVVERRLGGNVHAFVVEVRNCSPEVMHEVHASVAVFGQGVLCGAPGMGRLELGDDGTGVPATYSGRIPHLEPQGVRWFRLDAAGEHGAGIPPAVLAHEHALRAVVTFIDARQRRWGVVDGQVWSGEIPPSELSWACTVLEPRPTGL